MEILLVVLLTLRSIASTRGFSLPSNCQKSCGNISIEWPFGIGNGCFRPGFNLTCTNHTTNPTRLFLGDGTTEVSKIDMKQGLVYVKTQIITMGVGVDSISTSLIDLRNWPYSFNLITKSTSSYYESLAYNRLYVAGCSVIANLLDFTTNYTIDTCTTICSTTSQRQHQYSFGNGYCILDFDWNLANTTSWVLQLTRLNQTDLHLVNASSIKAFIYDANNMTTKDLEEIVKGRSSTRMTATLAWYINDHSSCKEAKMNMNTYACLSRNSHCYDAFLDEEFLNDTVGYFCRCSRSYQGNPYLPNGCQDTSFTPSPANDCATKCGSVDISFPFGLKVGCYRDQSFALTCNHTSNPPTLLFEYDYVVSNISLEEGQLKLKYKYGCLFYFIDETTPVTFLEEQTIYSWVIAYESCEDAKKNRTTFACIDEHSVCVETTNASKGQDVKAGYRCKCSEGYQGNPYLPNGCTDIDECKSPEMYGCNGNCTNTMGSYSCTCPKGTYGDPKHGACIPDKKQTLLLGIIIGISNGIGLLLLSTSFVILRSRWKKRNQKRIREKHFHKNHGLLLQQLISSDEDAPKRTKIFSLEEIEKATNNFDETRVLGRGGHGTVYKGILSDQRIVAIKRSKIVKKSEIDQFINEVAILSQISHRNVVKLFGCCLETEVPLLIYEFISNGTLSDHLHVPNGTCILSWEDRLRIASEAAGALTYLHSAASISIFHRDVKSSNILLDDNFTAKVSDFGASRFIPLDQTHIVTVVQGTFGYLDPEYYRTSQLTEKSDVYSFGVILLELLTGRKPIFSTEHEKGMNLSMHFLQAMKDDRLFDLVDDRVMKEGTEEELVKIVQLIEMCLRLKGAKRPTMKEVEYKLQGLRRIRKEGRGHCIVEDIEDTKCILSDSSYDSSDVLVDQENQATSRIYSLEMELMLSQYYPR